MNRENLLSWLGASWQAIVVAVWLLLVAVGGLILLVSCMDNINWDAQCDSTGTFSIISKEDTLRLEVVGKKARALCDTFSLKVHLAETGSARDTMMTVYPAGVGNDLLLKMILLAGALGASLFGVTSLVDFVGNKKYEVSWTLWYLFRPVIGVLFSLAFYLVGRGTGFFDAVISKDALYGALALAVLVGLFSKQALHKLSDIFDILFQNTQAPRLRDRLDSPTVPVITAVKPGSLTVNSQNRSIQVTGMKFAQNAAIFVGNRKLATTPGGADTLVATLDLQDVAAPGILEIRVQNPGSPEVLSAPYKLEVKPLPEQDPNRQSSEEEGGEEEENE